jgi:hypothetical protein
MQDDYRGQTLVYGDFPKLFKIKIYSDIKSMRDIDADLKNTDASLLAGFVSFLYAKVGYYNRTIYENSRYWGESDDGPMLSPEGRKTTQDTEEFWVDEASELMAWSEELNDLRIEKPGFDAIFEFRDVLQGAWAWSHYFKDEKTGSAEKVVFTSRGIKSISPEAMLDYIDPSCFNYVVIHPAVYPQISISNLKERFLESKNTSVLSIDDFAKTLIPDNEDRIKVLGKWIDIRNRVLRNLIDNQPLFNKNTRKPSRNLGASQLQKELVRIPSNASLISPEKPFSNKAKFRNAIKLASVYIHWLDKFFSIVGLEYLNDSLQQKKVKEIKILMAVQKEKGYAYYERFRKQFRDFRDEYRGEVSCELRILRRKDAVKIHDRWLISKANCFNVPSPDVVERGQLSEIKETESRPPFDRLWTDSKDIINDWSEIRKELTTESDK